MKNESQQILHSHTSIRPGHHRRPLLVPKRKGAAWSCYQAFSPLSPLGFSSSTAPANRRHLSVATVFHAREAERQGASRTTGPPMHRCCAVVPPVLLFLVSVRLLLRASSGELAALVHGLAAAVLPQLQTCDTFLSS
jgi:hypothetical protein